MVYDNNWFINKSKIIHGDKYDYSLVKYKNLRTKVKIVCTKHGEFEQLPEKHFMNRGCPYCGGTKKLTNEQFIKKAKEIHGDKYDYSLVNYVQSHTKVKIICPKHGEFEQLPYVHLNGSCCNKCSTNINNFIDIANKKHMYKYDYKFTNYKNTYTKVKIICPKHGEFEQFPQSHIDIGCVLCKKEKKFIQKSKIIHNNKYDYSSINYKDKYTKVKIICPKHGEFEQSVIYHIRGHGCKRCSDDIKKLNTNIFIKKAKKIYGDKYDYSLVNYINTFEKIKIICNKHGVFEISSNDHINLKRECNICNKSNGEKEIAYFLNNNFIKFETQKKFKECRNILPLSFDFYLPDYNYCIEFDGIQHYKPINYFGGIKKLKYTKNNDNIKNIFCKNNNIKLIRIKYNESIVEKIKKELKINI